MTQPMPPEMSDAEHEAALQTILGGCTDDEVSELAALAEAMHAEGGADK